MTLEEAKKLKPGDHILVEVVVREFMLPDCKKFINEQEEKVAIKHIDRYNECHLDFVYIDDIREKIAPPRRKFKNGDIVISEGVKGFYELADDEADKRITIAAYHAGNKTWLATDELTLVCAAENREDRKEDA